MQKIITSLPKFVRVTERPNRSPLPTEYPVVPKADPTSNRREREKWMGFHHEEQMGKCRQPNMAKIAKARAW
jgi:hypothetical protein